MIVLFILIILVLLGYLFRHQLLVWLFKKLTHLDINQSFGEEKERKKYSSFFTHHEKRKNPKREKLNTKEMMKRHLSKENSQYVDFKEEVDTKS